MQCASCRVGPAQLRRFGTRRPVCKRCFVREFEDEVHAVILRYRLIPPGSRVCIGVSGGKDSAALLHCLTSLAERYRYDCQLVMLAIDEGITGYRDNSLKCVYKARDKYQLETLILSYDDLYDGWTMDFISAVNKNKQNCLHCGIFRRQALERGAQQLRCDSIATGHNADDGVETILMNCERKPRTPTVRWSSRSDLRGDIKRLQRCCGVSTGCHCPGQTSRTAVGRIKPFYFCSQKEIVLYCHFLGLDYFSTECPYSETAFRGHVRALIKELEAVDPNALRRILMSHGTLPDACGCAKIQATTIVVCERCGMPCLGTQAVCQACQLVDSLNGKKKCC